MYIIRIYINIQDGYPNILPQEMTLSTATLRFTLYVCIHVHTHLVTPAVKCLLKPTIYIYIYI